MGDTNLKEAMHIQLKQAEISEALKQYIIAQGISLVGKSLDISFTAGRKGTGMSADLTINDLATEIPGFSTSEPEAPAAAKPTLVAVQPVAQEAQVVVVQDAPPEAHLAAEAQPAAQEAKVEAVQYAAEVDAPKADAAEAQPAAKTPKAASLFA